MNQFYNPLFLMKVLKSYFFDIDRLHLMDERELRRYQDRCLRHMVTFAYTVPLYHDLYVKAKVHPQDISGIRDLSKLPEVSKEDFARYYPDGIVSSAVKRENLIQVSTSGTTGKSLSLYVDLYDIVLGLFGYLRQFREYGINWRKHRITIIGDFAPHTVESGYINRGLEPGFNPGFLFRNIQWLNTNDPPEQLIDKIDAFQPYFLGGYNGMLGHLALLKQRGKGTHISPRYVASTGAALDKSLRQLIETTFQAHVFESYGSTESGPIAFQCRYGSYHVLSDYVYLEFLKNGEPVSEGEAGKLIVTKLFGQGTPVIRYNAINDIVSPVSKKCPCGRAGGLIGKVFGRDDLGLYLPQGKVMLPSAFSEIYSTLLYELQTTKVKDTMIIQHSKKNIEIQVVIDEKNKMETPSTAEILSTLQEGFQKKVGPAVEVTVQKVKAITRKGARIISYVDRETYHIKEYI